MRGEERGGAKRAQARLRTPPPEANALFASRYFEQRDVWTVIFSFLG